MLLALHALRLKGLAETDVAAAVWSRDPVVVAAELESARAHELVVRRDGRLPGWMLSATGRVEGERLLAAELDTLDVRDVVDAGYRRFLGMNQAFLDLCTDWQLKPDPNGGDAVVNDHTDQDHDDAVVSRLGQMHRELATVVAALGGAVPRFGRYQRGFAHAWEVVAGGDTDWFCRPVIDSYHTLWFELHEDLLATLGLVRSEETR